MFDNACLPLFLCSKKGEIPPKNPKNRKIDAFFINFCPKILKVDSNYAVHLICERAIKKDIFEQVLTGVELNGHLA